MKTTDQFFIEILCEMYMYLCTRKPTLHFGSNPNLGREPGILWSNFTIV